MDLDTITEWCVRLSSRRLSERSATPCASPSLRVMKPRILFGAFIFDRHSSSAISHDSALSEASISGFSWNHFVMVLAMIARGNNLFYTVIQPLCSTYYWNDISISSNVILSITSLGMSELICVNKRRQTVIPKDSHERYDSELSDEAT
jgi:hypothetical protein